MKRIFCWACHWCLLLLLPLLQIFITWHHHNLSEVVYVYNLLIDFGLLHSQEEMHWLQRRALENLISVIFVLSPLSPWEWDWVLDAKVGMIMFSPLSLGREQLWNKKKHFKSNLAFRFLKRIILKLLWITLPFSKSSHSFRNNWKRKLPAEFNSTAAAPFLPQVFITRAKVDKLTPLFTCIS